MAPSSPTVVVYGGLLTPAATAQLANGQSEPPNPPVDAQILTTDAPDDVSTLKNLASLRESLISSLESRVFGQRSAIEQMITTLFAGGHALLIGVPGLGKTRLVQSLAQALDLSFSRIQFTPDLMPSDVTGSEILEEDPVSQQRSFRFVPGPVFCNLLLADEINRTPPKTQSALLESMQEAKVSAGGHRHELPRPFCVFATRNPIEQEGTYPLPEAQLDRFMLQIRIEYPDAQAERAIVTLGPEELEEPLPRQLQAQELMMYQSLVRRVPVPEPVVDCVLDLIKSTRPQDPQSPKLTRDFVQLGAGPRAGQLLIRAAQARAALMGHPAVRVQDIHALAVPVLEHRLLLRFAAASEGFDATRILETLLDRLGSKSHS